MIEGENLQRDAQVPQLLKQPANSNLARSFHLKHMDQGFFLIAGRAGTGISVYATMPSQLVCPRHGRRCR